MGIFLIIVSIFLEGIFNLLFQESIIMPLFSILCLALIYPYFKNKNYLLLCSFLGFIYDLFNTNFYILNVIIFFVISYFIKYYFTKFEYKFISFLILEILIIFIYQFLLLIVFHITMYNKISLEEFIFILNHFYVINIFYIIFGYLINKKVLKI